MSQELEERIGKLQRPPGVSEKEWQNYLDSLRKDWRMAEKLGPEERVPEGFDKSEFDPE